MSLLSAELAATCSALGHYDENTKKYYADENPLDIVKDLIRYLRRDDENHDIRRQLGETKVLQTDLLPLLKSYWEETELFDVLLRLLVNLTSPPLILWNEEVPTDKNVRNYFMQIEGHLQSYKSSFADDALWAVLSSRLSKILELDHAERSEDDSLIVERILVLIRNILYVPADPAIERRPDNDANTHDQVAWAMHQSGILDIILYISSSSNEQGYQPHILEILFHLLRDQNATELGKTEQHRNHTEKIKDEAELMAIRHREIIKKQQKARVFSGARHSRFGGTYVVKSMKSISDNDLIYHKPLSRIDAISFDADKQKPKTPKNRLALHLETKERRSTIYVRLFFQEFCSEFLNGAYNTLMYNVKDQLVRAKSHSHDASYYLWAVRFFMEFNRAYKFEVKLVSETMSIQTFHYVQQHMENYFDMMQTDKKKLGSWSRRLHIALLAYRELLLTLCVMDKSPDGTVRDSSKVIKSNIFYVLEYRELVLTLMVTYNELKMSDQYLKDLIETQHIFLRSFEAFCKEGSVIVQQKSRGKRNKRKVATAPELPEFNLEREWDEASQQISSVLETNTGIPTDIVPFDAASEVPIDEQKSETMISIQRKLRRGEYENAVGLLRAAREVWPENDCFGRSNMSPEEEYLALKDIFLADLGENNPPVPQQPVFDANDEEEDEEDEQAAFAEGDLKFEDFVKRLAHPKIIRAAALALSKFEENSINTNHCIVKLLHRISFDSKMYVMMFQISLFITFRKIFALKEMPEYKELVKFVTYMLRQFFKVAEKNKKIYMEALFWKTTKDAYDIEFGYGSYQERSSASARAWTEEEEDEVRRLFMEHKEKQLEDDVVNWVLSNLIDNTRTRRGLLKKMKELYLLTDYKGPKKSRMTSRLPQQWGPEEEDQLTELYEQFKDAMDPIGCIIDRLNVPRPKNRIIEKLLVLGLIGDRKEVRKKRVKGASRQRSGRAGQDTQRSDASSESDASGDDIPRRPAVTLNPSIRGGSAQKKGKVKRAPAVVNVSARRLAEMTLAVLESGMGDALGWLKESFSDAIEDFDESTDEGIPLVPIMNYSVDAMENSDFQNLLLSMGVAKPFDEQETYWRIPCNMTLETMKSHEGLLAKAIEGILTVPEEENNTDIVGNGNNLHNEESSDEDIFDQLRRMNENNKNGDPKRTDEEENGGPLESMNEDEGDDEREVVMKQSMRKNARSTNNASTIIDQDTNIVRKDQMENAHTEKIKNKRKIKARARVMDDSSDNGGDLNEDSSDEDIFDKLRRKSQPNGSAEYDEPSKNLGGARKRRRLSSSDENSHVDPQDLLAIAEEKLKNENKKKKLSKKTGTKKTKKDKTPKQNQKATKKTAEKSGTSENKPENTFKSKEFISSGDDSSDDEESAAKVKEHYEKLLQNDAGEKKVQNSDDSDDSE